MKLTTFLLLISLMQVSAASFGQKVTLKANGITMNNIFNQIRKQTGYSVLVDGSDFSTNRKVDVNFSDTPLQTVLEELLKDSGFGYEIENKNILVERKVKSPVEQTAGRFQAIDVSGKVLDSDGRPLPGATVLVKGTKISTTTQSDGSFTLKGVDDDAVLVITYMGFETKEIKAERSLGSLRLVASTNPLDEVQVIAYGTTTRRLSTGNIGTVKAEDIEKQPVTNPLLTLKGRVPGLMITEQTGVSGGGVVVRIQGENSMMSGNAPLYVIDGVPISSYLPALNGGLLGNSGVQFGGRGTESSNEGNPLSYLNPTDIESIDVLKDADATSIYGSKAANGAILITTKKGKIGKMKLDATIQNGWGKAPYNYHMLNTREYLDMRYEAYRNTGTNWRSANITANDLKVWDTTRYTNWQKELLGNTMRTHRIQLGVSGGSAGMQYRLSGSYNKRSSVFPDSGNGNPTGSVSASLNSTSVDQKLSMIWTANYQYNRNELPSSNFLEAAMLLPPNAPAPFNSDGSINWAPNANGTSTFTANPFKNMMAVYKNTTSNLISNLVLGYKLIKEIEIRTSLGYSNLATDDFVPQPKSVRPPEERATTQNTAVYGYRKLSSWIAEPQINYKKKTNFGSINFLLGGTLKEDNTAFSNLLGQNYASDELLENIASATSLSSIASSNIQFKYMAYYGRLEYNSANKFIVNINARRDGSSNFGENKRFSNFWSFGGAWIFSEEKPIKNNFSWLSFGKLRATYGITGNDNIGNFQYTRTYIPDYNLQIPYQNITTLTSLGIPNPDLVWERVYKLSTGLDLGFLKDRLIFNVNYSRNLSDNQLLSAPLPSVTGATSMTKNLPGTVGNYTWEFGLNAHILKGSSFDWSSSINLSLATNKLVSYPDLESSIYSNLYVIGQPIDVLRVNRFGGVNSATGLYQLLDKNGNPTIGPTTDEDKVFRSMYPPTYGGLQNNFRWKDFSLSFTLQVVKKMSPNLFYGSTNNSPGTANRNQPVSILSRWKQSGDVSNIAKFTTVAGLSTVIGSDAWFTDSSFARLQNASLSWKIPTKYANKAGLQSAALSMNGQNLFTITNYSGPDPETGGLTALPPLRIFTVGLQVTF